MTPDVQLELEVEPPGLTRPGEGDPPQTLVGVWIVEPDNTRRSGWAALPADATNDDVAGLLVRVLLGAAMLRGPGLHRAVRDRMMTDGQL